MNKNQISFCVKALLNIILSIWYVQSQGQGLSSNYSTQSSAYNFSLKAGGVYYLIGSSGRLGLELSDKSYNDYWIEYFASRYGNGEFNGRHQAILLGFNKSLQRKPYPWFLSANVKFSKLTREDSEYYTYNSVDSSYYSGIETINGRRTGLNLGVGKKVRVLEWFRFEPTIGLTHIRPYNETYRRTIPNGLDEGQRNGEYSGRTLFYFVARFTITI